MRIALPQAQERSEALPSARTLSKFIFHSEHESSSEADDCETLILTARPSCSRNANQQLGSPLRTPLPPLNTHTANRDREESTTSHLVRRNNFVGESEPEQELRLRETLPQTLLFMDSEEDEEEQAKAVDKERTREERQDHSLEVELSEPDSKEPQREGPDKEEQPQEERREEAAEGEGEMEQNQQGKQEMQKEEESVSLLQITPQVRQRSAYFEHLLTGQPSDEAMQQLMLQPIRRGTVQMFEVHVYSSLSEKSFELWVDRLPTMQLLMRASKTIRPHRTSYELTGPAHTRTALLTSNLDRSEFALTAHAHTLATITCGATVQHSKNLVLYYPACTLPQAQTQSLKQLYQQKGAEVVEYVVTASVDAEQRQQMMRQYGLRASAKSMEFKGRSGSLRAIIGKKGSKRYSLIGGGGLSPAQLFSLAIVNIET